MLERKDVRLKLDHDIHAAAKVISETNGMEIAEWCESLVIAKVLEVVHSASLVVDRLNESGSLGTLRDMGGFHK